MADTRGSPKVPFVLTSKMVIAHPVWSKRLPPWIVVDAVTFAEMALSLGDEVNLAGDLVAVVGMDEVPGGDFRLTLADRRWREPPPSKVAPVYLGSADGLVGYLARARGADPSIDEAISALTGLPLQPFTASIDVARALLHPDQPQHSTAGATTFEVGGFADDRRGWAWVSYSRQMAGAPMLGYPTTYAGSTPALALCIAALVECWDVLPPESD